MNIYGSLLIIFTIIIRAVAMNKLPKKTFIALWMIIVSRLLMPYTMPGLINVYPVADRMGEVTGINQPAFIPQEIFIQPNTPAITENNSGISQETTQNYNAPAAENHEFANINAPAADTRNIQVYTIIWLMGIIASGAFFIIPHVICSRKYKTALPAEDHYINLWAASHRLLRKYKIMISDEIISPFTYGIFKPVIILPESIDMNNHALLDYILTHEYVHIKRFDIILKWLSAVTLCVNWFNPLVWAMYILMNRDIELSCDEGVVRLKGEANKKSYALMLLDMESEKRSFNPLVNHFNKNSLKERVMAIMQIKKITLAKIILAFALIISSCLILISSCTGTETPDIQESTEGITTTGLAAEDNFSEIDLFLPPIVEKSFFERRISTPMMNDTRAFDQINAYYTLRESSASDFFVPVYVLASNISNKEREILLEHLRTYTDLTSGDLFKMYSDYDIPIPVTVDPAYAHVRFGDAENILLFEVEWHTPETYLEQIERFKNEYEDEYRWFLETMEENLIKMKEGAYNEPRVINGNSEINPWPFPWTMEEIIEFGLVDSEGYLIWNIYPYSPFVWHVDEDGIHQNKSFSEVNSQREYEQVLRNEIIPYCDELLAQGLITQEDYDLFTPASPLDRLVKMWFD